MITIIKKEIIRNIYVYTIILFILLLTITLFANELLIIILDPIKEINNDWHNKIMQNIINDSFHIADTMDLLLHADIDNEIDYIPVCEININTQTLYIILAKIIINVTTLCFFVVIQYELWVATIPHLYSIEKKSFIRKQASAMCNISAGILMTHLIWVRLYMNISMHNYNEYNYYEFDIDIDLNQYVNRYIIAIYLHIFIMIYVNKNNAIYFIVCIMLLYSELLMLEIIYYVIIITIKSEIIKINKHIKNKLCN